MAAAGSWLAPVLFPIVLVGAMIFRLLQALLYGAINLAFAAIFGVNLTYAAALRLAVISITPVILLDTIFWIGGADFSYWFLVGIAVTLFYMAMAVRANAEPVPGGV